MMKHVLLWILIFTFLPIFSHADESIDEQSVNISQEISNYTKSPTEALLWSILPGGGQIYVESYLKAGMFIGGATTFATMFFYNDSKYQPLQNQFDDNKKLLDGMERTDPRFSQLSQEQLLLSRQKESFRNAKHQAGVFFVLTWAISAVDAFVGAHLFDFNVEDDLVLALTNSNQGIRLNFSKRF